MTLACLWHALCARFRSEVSFLKDFSFSAERVLLNPVLQSGVFALSRNGSTLAGGDQDPALVRGTISGPLRAGGVSSSWYPLFVLFSFTPFVGGGALSRCLEADAVTGRAKLRLSQGQHAAKGPAAQRLHPGLAAAALGGLVLIDRILSRVLTVCPHMRMYAFASDRRRGSTWGAACS